MVHTPLRVPVQHTSPLSGRSHLYYTYMHKHTCTRSHMLSDPFAAIQPECDYPCIFGGCSWAQSPTPASIPEYTPPLLKWQYSCVLSKAGDTPEEALIWRRKRCRFSAFALPPSPPRPFWGRRRWNVFLSAGKSFLPKIKTAVLKLFFRGSPWCLAFLAAKEQNVEITGLGVEEISSHMCLGVPVCVCPPTPQRQICSHTGTLQIILPFECDANVKSEVSDWLCPPMRDVDSLVLSFLPTVDCSTESVPIKHSAKRWHNRKAGSSNFWKIELNLYCQQEMKSVVHRAG